jgi:polysaccharide export outer membrane protein
MRKAVKQISSITLLLCSVFFAAVYGQEKPKTPANLPTLTIGEPNEQSSNDAGKTVAALQRGENTRRYRIGPGDEIIIEVARHPIYSAVKRVDDRGMITLHRINQPIQAVCKTENELSQEIANLYKRIIREPYVNVYVKDYKSQPVAVMGAVEKGGQFFINRKMRLIQAVSLAGGPTKEAGSKVILARMGDVDLCSNNIASENGETLKGKVYTYNLRRIIEGDEQSNPWVEPGDIVSILEADKAYVIGNVKEQKTILLKEPVTLTQAIAAAGGADASSKLKQVFILRQDDQGNKQRLPYDLLAINSSKGKDPYLLPNDIVEVPVDAKKSNLDTLKKAFINGLPAVLPFLF